MFLNDRHLLKTFLIALYLGIFTMFLFYSDFPLPHGDDLFFAGTSVHYAETGNFLNPGVYDYTMQFSEIQKPYWFVPLHMRLLGLWLSYSDISDASIRIYVLLCIIITSYLLIKWFEISKNQSTFISFLIPIIITFGFRWSLRPECTAIPLLVTSLFLIFNYKNRWSQLFALIFLGLSTLSTQIILFLCTPLICVIAYLNYANSNFRVFAINLISAIILCSFIFLLCIDFEINQFFRMFFDCVSNRTSSILENFNLFYFLSIELGSGIFLRLPSFLLLFLILIKKPYLSIHFKWHGIALILGLLISISVYAKSFEVILFFSSFITIVYCIHSLNNPKFVLCIIACLCAIRQGGHLLIYNAFCEKSYSSMHPLDINQTYIIDEYTIRKPLEWNFPKNWKIAPDFYTTDSRLLNNPPSETWIISQKNLSYFYPSLYQQEKVTYGNKKFINLPLRFWEYQIIQ
jgi:hypothetical protein